MLFTNKHELHSCCTSIGTTQQYSTFIRKQHYRSIIILFIYTVQILKKYLSHDDNSINVRYMISLVNLFDKQQHVSLVRVPIKHPTISSVKDSRYFIATYKLRLINHEGDWHYLKLVLCQTIASTTFFLRLQWPKHYFRGNQTSIYC